MDRHFLRATERGGLSDIKQAAQRRRFGRSDALDEFDEFDERPYCRLLTTAATNLLAAVVDKAAVDDTPQPKRIRLMYHPGCGPIWSDEADVGNVALADLALSDLAAASVHEWVRRWEQVPDPEDTSAATAQLHRDGAYLWTLLRRELDPSQYRLVYQAGDRAFAEPDQLPDYWRPATSH